MLQYGNLLTTAPWSLGVWPEICFIFKTFTPFTTLLTSSVMLAPKDHCKNNRKIKALNSES